MYAYGTQVLWQLSAACRTALADTHPSIATSMDVSCASWQQAVESSHYLYDVPFVCTLQDANLKLNTRWPTQLRSTETMMTDND